MIRVSIICPVYNEESSIDRCIQSMLAQDYPSSQWELLLIDGGSRDRTRDLIQPYLLENKNVHLLDNPNRTSPYAMNIGIRNAQGEYICRVDAHAAFPANYISTLLHYIEQLPDAANVGVACRTEPRNDSPKARAIAAVLSNRFGVGNSTFRLGTTGVTEADTVPFGFFRKEIFTQVGMYNEHLTRNQDIELNKRIKAHGGKLYLVPDTYCTYYARATYSDLASNNYGNGRWNILTVHYTRDFHTLSIRHFIPLLFVLSLVIPICLIPIWSVLGWLSALSLCAYLILITAISAKESLCHHIHFIYLLLAFIVLHFSYGAGSLIGILHVPFIRRQ